MLVIGLTGPSGAGKGVVAEILSTLGLPVIDADQVYHELLVPPSSCLDALTAHFGVRILDGDGTLNRKALGQLVFGNSTALARLNEITHRYVMEEIHARMQRLRRANYRAVVLDAPQLFEAGAERDCNVIISVLADKRIRLERILARDGISVEAALARMEAQKSDEFFRTHSNYIIENNGATDALAPQVHHILAELGVVSK